MQNWYLGSDRSMLIPNTLFRMGGAAMVLTNRLDEVARAKYELQHVVRVHLGADDKAYRYAANLGSRCRAACRLRMHACMGNAFSGMVAVAL